MPPRHLRRRVGALRGDERRRMIVAQRLPFNALEMVWNPAQLHAGLPWW